MDLLDISLFFLVDIFGLRQTIVVLLHGLPPKLTKHFES